MTVHPTLSAVTERIRARSQHRREAYLKRVQSAYQSGVTRHRINCTNMAHAYAAMPVCDKGLFKADLAPNIGIVTAFNDMLSAHQPYESYPALIKEAVRKASARSSQGDEALLLWLQQVYGPIDRLLGQVINPFPSELKALSADPYDDRLMEAFCSFLEQSQAKLEKVESLYRSMAAPASAQGFSLSVYHCLSQVKDALVELERYTMGYVDSYLRDGREMLREAKRRRSLLQEERRRLEI